MKIATAALALTLAWMIGPLAHAVADDPGPDWMPREQIRQKLLEAGYTEITERRLSRRLFRYLSCDEMSQRALILRDP